MYNFAQANQGGCHIHTYIRTYVVAYMHLHRQPVLAWKKDGLPVVSEWVVEA